jgi:hypothetical protein
VEVVEAVVLSKVCSKRNNPEKVWEKWMEVLKICSTDSDDYQKALLKIGKRQDLFQGGFAVSLNSRKHIIKSKRKDDGMLKRTCGIFASLAIFFIAANAMAQDPDFPKGRWWTESNVVDTLNLNNNEVEQIEKANADWRLHRGLLKSEIRVSQDEINSWKARKSSNPQGKERIIRKLEDKIEKARSSLPKLKPAYINKVRTILGPARFEKLLSLKP